MNPLEAEQFIDENSTRPWKTLHSVTWEAARELLFEIRRLREVYASEHSLSDRLFMRMKQEKQRAETSEAEMRKLLLLVQCMPPGRVEVATDIAIIERDGLERPLSCMIEGGQLVVRIGINTLAFSAREHPAFWDGTDDKTPCIDVVDNLLFATSVVCALKSEAEDGSSLLSRTLDRAMQEAVEDGCEGVRF